MSQALPPGFGDWTGDRKYELRGTLGAGAMGVVMDGFDRQIERRVAIKVVRKPAPDDAEAVEAAARFKREAQAAGRLSHPGIVGVHDYGENDETAWIVMEMVEGGTLKQRLDRDERLPVREAVRITGQVLAALGYAHGRGVIHRDIKPANVMLTETGDPKLADFGIARLENSSMTQVGTLMGTPSYMAPEQLRGEALDARADIWATGVMLYQLLTGEKPFTGGFSAVMHKVLNTEPVAPSALASSVPAAMDAVVMRALAKRPDGRWPDARAFAEALEDSLRPGAGTGSEDATMVAPAARPAPPPVPPPVTAPVTTPGPTPAAPRAGRPGWVLPAAGAGALAVAGLAAFLLIPRGETPPAPAGPPAATPSAPGPVASRADPRPDAPSAPLVAAPAAPPAAPAASPPTESSAAVSPTEPARPEGGIPQPRPAPPERPAAPAPPAAGPPAPGPQLTGPAAPAAPDAPAPAAAARPAPAPQGAPGPQASVAAPPRPDLPAIAAAAAAAAPCGMIASREENNRLRLRGVAPRAEVAAIRERLDGRIAAGAAQADLVGFDGPFCPLAGAVRPVLAAPGEGPEVTVDGRPPLRKGQFLRFAVRVPPWATHLHVAYAMGDSTVARLEPGAVVAPGAQLRLGDPRPGFEGWEIGDPFGTDLLVVVASEEPLFAPGAPASEGLAPYAQGFAAAVQLARAAGRRIAALPVVVDTVER